MTFFIALGTIIFFCLVLLIAFNFRLFVQLLSYALIVAAGLAVLGILYVIVRIIAAISHRISLASVARSKARIERERVRIEQERVHQAHIQVRQGRVQVRSQQAKLERENYAFYQKYEQPGSSQNPQAHHPIQSPYRTRTLREVNQEPLVRILPALSQPPPAPEPVETELEALGMPAKGQVFAYKSYKKYLKPEQLFIGIRKDGTPRVGSWHDFKIVLILGSSSSGKSTTVLEKCLCHVEQGGLLVVCDPGGFKPDSITQRMGALQGALMPGTSVALEHDDIMQNVERFRVELERRRRGASMDIPILLVVDELNGLLMDKEIKKDLTEVMEKFAQQARGYNMYMILCAQRASGLAAIRNSVISYICHKCPEMEASKILPARYAKLAPELGVGQTFVSDANGFIDSLQQICISPEDIAARAGGAHSPLGATPHHPQTEPIAPRVYGAPARRQTATPQQKLVLRRTNLVQDQTAAPHFPPIAPQPVPSHPSPGKGAIWGEETQIYPPRPPLPPQAGPMTEELVPKHAPASSPTMPQPMPPGSQDTFEMLALRRKKKK